MTDRLPVLSFHRPWTDLILGGAKKVENRSWLPQKMGLHTFPFTLVVHGAKKYDPTALLTADRMGAWEYPLLDRDSPTGYLGTVEVVGAHDSVGVWPENVCPWGVPSAVHWVLANPRKFPAPIPGLGQQGVWSAPANVRAAVEALPGPDGQPVGHKHDWRFWGDDPYLICRDCDAVQDALTGAMVRGG